jgi:hypothetical protein
MGFKFVPKVDLNRLNRSLFDTRIYIGYSDEEVHKSGYTAAELGKMMSDGGTGPEGNEWPARPHLKEGLDAGQYEIKRAINDYGKSLFGIFPKKGAAQKIADVGRTAVEDYIQSGALEPNAPFTIAKKGSDVPLIDTGELTHLIDTKIVKGVI